MVLSLRVAGLRFAWERRAALLIDIGFGLSPGDVLCLLGPNGCGKTTLLRCVLGFERIAAGTVELRGRDVKTLGVARMAREIAYVPQGTGFAFPFSAFDVVLMGRNPHLRFMADPTAADRSLVQAALRRLGIGDMGARRFDELSGGERQLVLIARALAQEAKVLVMDEPCAGLDLGNQMQVLCIIRSLAEQGYSVLLSSHTPDHAFALGGRVALLVDGRLRGPGAPRDLISGESLSALYRTPIDVVRLAQGRSAGYSVAVPLVGQPEVGDAQRVATR